MHCDKEMHDSLDTSTRYAVRSAPSKILFSTKIPNGGKKEEYHKYFTLSE